MFGSSISCHADVMSCHTNPKKDTLNNIPFHRICISVVHLKSISKIFFMYVLLDHTCHVMSCHAARKYHGYFDKFHAWFLWCLYFLRKMSFKVNFWSNQTFHVIPMSCHAIPIKKKIFFKFYSILRIWITAVNLKSISNIFLKHVLLNHICHVMPHGNTMYIW